MATFAEISATNRKQLLKDLDTSKKELFDIKYQVANKQSKASHHIKNLKKTIAQILTALTKAPVEVEESKDKLENAEEKGQDVPAQKKVRKTVSKK